VARIPHPFGMKPPKGWGTRFGDVTRSVGRRILPDVDAVLWGQVELVRGLDVEGGVPAVVVADGGGAEFVGGVGVGEDLAPEGGVAGDGAPVLSEGDEELLVAGEVVDFGGVGAFEGGVEAVVGCGETGYVSDIFSEGLLAVDGDIGEGFVGVVLGGEGGGDLFEVGEVFGSPPVADAAFGVECRSLGVEGVTDLVADDGADGAVVGGGGSFGIEERRLQDGGGEVEAVVEREVDGVDGLGRHAPLLAVDGLADAAEGVVIFKEVGAPDVGEEVVGGDFVGGVAAPLVWVAYADLQGA
jgi:hypothetical protein